MLAIIAASGSMPGGARDELGSLIDRAELIIAADGGLAHLADLGARVDLVVGDLDSAEPAMVQAARRAGTEVVEFGADKDETDLELAMTEAVERGADQIVVVGLFGGRVDHQLANVALVADRRWFDAGASVWVTDGARRMWVVHNAVRLAETPGATLTVLPWGGDAIGVTTTGLRWPLDDERLALGSPRGVSNICLEPDQSVTVAAGTLLVIVDQTEAVPMSDR